MVQSTIYFVGSVSMQKIDNSITFCCPGCKEAFEFDLVGEYELVLCPICGTEFMTVKRGQRLMLEHFEFSPPESSPCFEIEERRIR